jgi:hypothetical protein
MLVKLQVNATYGDQSAILDAMLIPPFKPKPPEIAECDQTPLVQSLLQIIGQQQEQIQRLQDEIRRLQGGPPRPQLKSNTLGTGRNGDGARNGPRLPS